MILFSLDNDSREAAKAYLTEFEDIEQIFTLGHNKIKSSFIQTHL